MTTAHQIIVGSTLLTLSAIIHIATVAYSVPLLNDLAGLKAFDTRRRLRLVALLSFTVLSVVFAHTVQVWVWSFCFLLMSELPDLPTSFYFATVTYTTLGYGDIVLAENSRIVGTFCAITGLLTFGISTAYLMGVLTRIMPVVFGGDQRR